MTIDADNSKLYSDAEVGWNVQANTLYADFHGEEALFGSVNVDKNNNNTVGAFEFYNWVTGELKIRDGATMRTSRGVKMNNASLSVTFDGGKFEILSNKVQNVTTSTWNYVEDSPSPSGRIA